MSDHHQYEGASIENLRLILEIKKVEAEASVKKAEAEASVKKAEAEASVKKAEAEARKAEAEARKAEAEARKAEAEASVKKVEAEARKAEAEAALRYHFSGSSVGSLASQLKNVSLENMETRRETSKSVFNFSLFQSTLSPLCSTVLCSIGFLRVPVIDTVMTLCGYILVIENLKASSELPSVVVKGSSARSKLSRMNI
jgi:hypothetical protein